MKVLFGKILKVGGYFQILSFIILFIGMFFIREGIVSSLIIIITGAIMFLLPGFLLIKIGNSMQKSAKLVKEYRHLVVDKGVTSMMDLSVLLRKDMEVIKRELRSLIQKSHLRGYYIDEERELILNKDLNPITTASSPKGKRITVKCSSCGGSSDIFEGEEAHCRYCDTAINY